MKKFYFIYTGLIITLLFISCQKNPGEITQQGGGTQDDNPPPPPPPPPAALQCKLVKGYYYGGSTSIQDSVLFTYTGDKLTKAEGRDEYALYFYTGNNITGRKFYEKPGNLFYSIDTIEYDNSNRITQWVRWEYPYSYSNDTTKEIFSFIYQGNQLIKVVETYIILNYSTTTGNYLFTTNAQGNIERIYTANEQNIISDSISYAYNTDSNYFKKVHPHFFLFDPFFKLYAGRVPHFPYFYSRDNVNRFTILGNTHHNIVYEVDSLKNVTSLSRSGFNYMKYKYSCQ